MGNTIQLNTNCKTLGSMGTGPTLDRLYPDETCEPQSEFHFRNKTTENTRSVVPRHIGGLPQFNRFAPTFNSGSGFQASGGYGSYEGGGSSSSDSDGLSAGQWALIVGGAALLGLFVYALATAEPTCGGAGQSACPESRAMKDW